MNCNVGRRLLSTYLAARMPVWLPVQFWWTFSGTLASFLHEKKSSKTNCWVLEIWRWEFTVYLHRCCTEGKTCVFSKQLSADFTTYKHSLRNTFALVDILNSSTCPVDVHHFLIENNHYRRCPCYAVGLRIPIQMHSSITWLEFLISYGLVKMAWKCG